MYCFKYIIINQIIYIFLMYCIKYVILFNVFISDDVGQIFLDFMFFSKIVNSFLQNVQFIYVNKKMCVSVYSKIVSVYFKSNIFYF